MSADAAADADAAAERRLNHSIPRTYFVRGIQLAVWLHQVIKLINPELDLFIPYIYCVSPAQLHLIELVDATVGLKGNNAIMRMLKSVQTYGPY